MRRGWAFAAVVLLSVVAAVGVGSYLGRAQDRAAQDELISDRIDLAYVVVRPRDTCQQGCGWSRGIRCDSSEQCVRQNVLLPAMLDTPPLEAMVAAYAATVVKPQPGGSGRLESTVTTTLVQFADAAAARVAFPALTEGTFDDGEVVSGTSMIGEQSQVVRSAGRPPDDAGSGFASVAGAFQLGSLVAIVNIEDYTNQAPSTEALTELMTLVESRASNVLSPAWDGPGNFTLQIAGSPSYEWYAVVDGAPISRYSAAEGQIVSGQQDYGEAMLVYHRQQTVEPGSDQPPMLFIADVYRFPSAVSASAFLAGDSVPRGATQELADRQAHLIPVPDAMTQLLESGAVGFVYESPGNDGVLYGSLIAVRSDESVAVLNLLNLTPVSAPVNDMTAVAREGQWVTLEELATGQERCFESGICASAVSTPDVPDRP